MKKVKIALILFMTCIGGLRSQVLNGSYTIGGSSPNYASFTAAVNDLKTKGVSGPVTFNIRNGTYTENIVITQVTGASKTNTITFQSESGDSTMVTLKYSDTTTQVVHLNGADHLIFRKLTIESSQASFSILIYLDNTASNNKFEKVIFKGKAQGKVVGNDIVRAANFMDSANVFMNNLFINGYRGLAWFGNNTGKGSGMIVRGNTFKDQYNGAMYISYQNKVEISYNVIEATTAQDYKAVYVLRSDKGVSIFKNKVSITANAGAAFGFQLDNIVSTVSSRSYISNNFISATGSGTGSGIGISMANTTYMTLIYNSINVFSTYPTTIAVNFNSGSTKANMFNNTLVSIGSNKIYSAATNTLDSSDYNNLYTGTNFYYFRYNYKDYWLPSFQEWKDSTRKEENSITINPFYKSPSDLHVTTTGLNAKAWPTGLFATDIDGEARDALKPDIGADEYTPTSLDAGIRTIDSIAAPYCLTTRPVTVNLRNYGGVSINSAIIHWTFNGTPQPSYTWTGNLAPDTEVPVSLGTVTLTPLYENTISSWTTNPNNAVDNYAFNDSAALKRIFVAMNGTYTIGGTSPSFATVRDFVEVMNKAGICGPVLINIRNGIYKDSLNLYPAGTSPVNTITIQSESQNKANVTILAENVEAVYLIKGSHITIQHLRLTTNSSNGDAIFLTPKSNNITIKNCTTDGGINGYESPFLIIENVICNGKIMVIGPKSSNLMKGLTIRNSAFGEFHMEYVDSVTITRNTFYQSYIVGMVNFTVDHNTIIGTNNSLRTIIFISCSGNQNNPSRIANNFITHVASSYAAVGRLCGLVISSSGYIDIINNNLYVNNPYLYEDDRAPAALVFGNYSSNNINIVNNVFANYGTGWAIEIPGGMVNNLHVDYNCYYAKSGILCFNKTKKYTRLQLIQTELNTDDHSFEADPVYTSSTDLHVSTPELSDRGISWSGVTDDYDLEARDPLYPDVGADEIGPTPPYAALNDTAYICSGNPIELDAGNPGASFTWSTGASTQKITVSSPGTYWVSVSNGQGSNSDTIRIFTAANPSVYLGEDTTIKYADTLVLNAGPGHANYYWSNYNITQTMTVKPIQFGSGTHKIYVTISDNSGCYASDTILVTILPLTTGSEEKRLSQLSIYPNPGDGHFTIILPEWNGKQVQVQIFSVEGQLVYEKTNVTETKNELDLRQQPQGIYLLKVQSERSTIVKRLVKL